MRVTTLLTIDMNTGATLEHKWFDYAGPVAWCKVDQTAKDAEAKQAGFTNTLMNAFKTQFGAQTAITNFLTGKLTAQLNNPQGYDQSTKAALNSNAITQSATDVQNAIKATQAQAAAHGGATALPSGVSEQIAGQINAAGATEKSSALSQIQLSDEQLKEQHRQEAINGLLGTASEINPLGYAGSSNGGSSAVAGLSNAVSSSQQVGFWNTMGNAFAGSAGKLLGGGNASQGGGFFGMGG